MRVAVNAVPFELGSSLRPLISVLEAWRRAGESVEVVFFASREPVIERFERRFSDVTVERFARGLHPALHFVRQQTHLARRMREAGCDVVWSANFGLLRCPLPQLVHHRNLLLLSDDPSLRPYQRTRLGDGMRGWMARRSLDQAAANVFVSHYLRGVAERSAPASSPRNHVIHNALSAEWLDAPRLVTEPTARLLAVQRPDQHKDLPTLVAALQACLRRAPEAGFTLRVVGAGDWGPARERIRSMGLSDRIDFGGYVDEGELRDAYRTALCLVQTSRAESFGNAPLEAMSQGCPVVACDTTAVPEVVGDAARLVPAGDAQAIADSVLSLHRDEAARRQWIERGYVRARSFDADAGAMRMLRLLEGCVQGA